MRNKTKGSWWLWSLILLYACESKTLVPVEDKFCKTDSIGVCLELEKLKNDTSFGEARVYNFEARIKNNSLKPIYVLRPIGTRFYPESSHVFVEQHYKNGHGIGCFGEPNGVSYFFREIMAYLPYIYKNEDLKPLHCGSEGPDELGRVLSRLCATRCSSTKKQVLQS